MSELTPLLASTEDDLELLLLRSAESDEPAAGALPKVAAALGVGATALGIGAGTVLAEQAIAGSGALAKPVTLVSVLKWLGVGMTAGALVGGGAHVAFRPMRGGAAAVSAPAVAPALPGEMREIARVVVPPPPPAAEPAEATEEAPLEAAPKPVSAGSSVTSGAPAPTTAPLSTVTPLGSTASFASEPAQPATPEQASALSEEVRSLDAARRELAAGRARAALTVIDAYRARFPQGSLRAEATVLRVEALLGSGDRAGAEREANVIVRAAPGSRHAARVLDLLGQ